MRKVILFTLLSLSSQWCLADYDFSQQLADLNELAVGEHRSPQHKDRNRFRNPAETLAFFGLRDNMTVVEISPGGAGWYTEILAPYLRQNGKLYAASYDPSAGDYFARNSAAFEEKLRINPNLYNKVQVTVFNPPKVMQGAPAGTADMVVTFRNLHNYLEDGVGDVVFAFMYQMLKPGGILGVVQHRAGKKSDPKMGYVSEKEVITLANNAGFEFVVSAEINANPKDTKNYAEGVWTLPPSYELGDKDKDKYKEIGESDRMTLKFVKPVK